MAFDPITGIAGAVEGATNLATTIINAVTSARNLDEARKAMQKASEAYNIPLPQIQQMIANTVGPSAMAGIHTDPTIAGAQTDALAQLKDISDSGGLTTEDKVNNEMLQRDAAQKAMAQRQSIVNVLKKSGQAPGGVSAALQLGAARDQQEAGALAGAQTAADARKRAIQAVLDRGTQAGNIRSQAFNEDSTKASAADRIAQYNASAQERAQRFNTGISQQNYENQMRRAQGQAGVQKDWADYLSGKAHDQAAQTADMGSGIGKLGSGIIQTIGRGVKGRNTDTSGGDGFSQAPVPMGPEGSITEEERQQRGY